MPVERTPEEEVAWDDFIATFKRGPLADAYEDKWDQGNWDTAIADYKARYDPEVLQSLWTKMGVPPWEVLEEQTRAGPPAFLRPGWVSPLIGKSVDLSWLDQEENFEWLKGSPSGWKEAKIVVIEFWATWCGPCLRVFPHLSEVAAAYGDKVKVIGFNNEVIFNPTDTPDLEVVRTFVKEREDMEYNVAIDLNRVAIDLFDAGEKRSIPTAILVRLSTGTVEFVGSPTKMDETLLRCLQ